MALHAMVLLGKASSGGGVFRSVSCESGRPVFWPGKVSASSFMSAWRAGGHRRHLRILCGYLREHEELHFEHELRQVARRGKASPGRSEFPPGP